ncbi:MAG: hypothetical protein Q9224_000658 [Gallowayella concinna]
MLRLSCPVYNMAAPFECLCIAGKNPKLAVDLQLWHRPPMVSSSKLEFCLTATDSRAQQACYMASGHCLGHQQIPASVCPSFLNLTSAGKSLSTATEMDKTGNQECLRFPPFHQEMLSQDWWNPGEDIGRVKVVISEGIASGPASQGPPSGFRRVKNIVAFSFQHAPLAVLEDAGIAWPHAGMWNQMGQPLYTPSSPCKVGAVIGDAHAHSPRRRHNSSGYSTNATASMAAPQMLMGHSIPPSARRTAMLSDSSWASNPYMQDPFLEQHRHQAPRQWGTRVSTSDDSMPDYSHSITPRSSRDVSLHEMPGMHGGSALQQESQFEELMAAFSPGKTEGTQAPPTTRVSSASITPPTAYRSLSATKTRVGSFPGQARSVSMTMREAPAGSCREASDVSMNSRLSDKSRVSEALAREGEDAHSMVRRTPASEVKGRKEGRSSESNLLAPPSRQTGTVKRRPQSMTSKGDVSSSNMQDGGKRKREGVTSTPDLVSEHSEGGASSPSKRVWKKGSQDSLSNASQEDSTRAPLSSLENIQ